MTSRLFSLTPAITIQQTISIFTLFHQFDRIYSKFCFVFVFPLRNETDQSQVFVCCNSQSEQAIANTNNGGNYFIFKSMLWAHACMVVHGRALHFWKEVAETNLKWLGMTSDDLGGRS
jgi:hypothetical protein